MSTVTESIYSGKGVIIPLADVQHIETHNPAGVSVVTKHTRWDRESDTWANNIWVDKGEAEAFKAAWCRYRSELEQPTLARLEPQNSVLENTTAQPNIGEVAIQQGLMDSPTAFAHRNKIEEALRSISDDGKSDAGIGFGGFDFWIKLQGVEYYLHAKPSKSEAGDGN